MMEILKVLTPVQLKDRQRGQTLSKESHEEFLNYMHIPAWKRVKWSLNMFIKREAMRVGTGSGTLLAAIKVAG